MPLANVGTLNSKARRTLRRHIAEKWPSQAEFARACGIPEKAISWYLRGRSAPSLQRAIAMEKVSSGEVRCLDWEEK